MHTLIDEYRGTTHTRKPGHIATPERTQLEGNDDARIIRNESVLGFGALFFTAELFVAQLEALLKDIRHLGLARSALDTQIEVLKLL